jgi:hypothetical protein
MPGCSESHFSRCATCAGAMNRRTDIFTLLGSLLSRVSKLSCARLTRQPPDLLSPVCSTCRRLDCALTEMKRKHDMPVKGWRPVLAIHNAKALRFREEHKVHMEQVSPFLRTKSKHAKVQRRSMLATGCC